MSLLTFVLIFVSSFAFAFLYINVSFVYVIRSLGALGKFNAKSFNLTQALLILNSFFAATSLTAIAFLIDTNPDIKIILIIFVISLLLIFVFHILIIFKFNYVVRLVDYLLSKYYKQIKFERSSKVLISKSFNYDFIISIAWFSHLIGFIFPSLMAVTFNDYRTSLFQLSFIFNSLGTFLTILIIEKKLSIMADKKMNQIQKMEIINYLSNILCNRVVTTFMLLLLIVFLYFYLSQ